METFQAIKEYADEHEEVSISHLCHILKVSRSGYYKWLQHQETTSEQENLGLMDVIKELHSQHNGILGYRRMTLFVNRKLGTSYNKETDSPLDAHSRSTFHYQKSQGLLY